MANSLQQARNVDQDLPDCGGSVSDGRDQLVDDMIDSRWTLTIAAWLLRANGSDKVWPLTLALAGVRS